MASRNPCSCPRAKILRAADIIAQSVHIEEAVEEPGPSSKLELMPAQRNAIYQEVHKGLSASHTDRQAPSTSSRGVDDGTTFTTWDRMKTDIKIGNVTYTYTPA
jgi:hypothetical protein